MTGNGAPRPTAFLVAMVTLAVLACAGFAALGNWQIARRAWKLDLIARVEQRVHAAPVVAPGIDAWPRVSAASDEYRRVRVEGNFHHDREVLVHASTELGSGYWVLTPLQTADDAVVLVNRGFVPPERRERATRAAGEPIGAVNVTGLLRISEPDGGFLRRNDPATNRWYSRDVQAIAKAYGWTRVAPYFIDADAASPQAMPDHGTWPAGGLTVTAFDNSHLAYAITWYGLAAMVAMAAGHLIGAERRLRRRRVALSRS